MGLIKCIWNEEYLIGREQLEKLGEKNWILVETIRSLAMSFKQYASAISIFPCQANNHWSALQSNACVLMNTLRVIYQSILTVVTFFP